MRLSKARVHTKSLYIKCHVVSFRLTSNQLWNQFTNNQSDKCSHDTFHICGIQIAQNLK